MVQNIKMVWNTLTNTNGGYNTLKHKNVCKFLVKSVRSRGSVCELSRSSSLGDCVWWGRDWGGVGGAVAIER